MTAQEFINWKRYRKATVVAIADFYKISRNTVYNWMNGRHALPLYVSRDVERFYANNNVTAQEIEQALNKGKQV